MVAFDMHIDWNMVLLCERLVAPILHVEGYIQEINDCRLLWMDCVDESEFAEHVAEILFQLLA